MMLMTDLDAIRRFVFAGKARFTITSGRTGRHFTFKIQRAQPDIDQRGSIPFFASVLRGSPDNWRDWRYIGLVGSDQQLHKTAKSPSSEAESFKALAWFLRHLRDDDDLLSLVRFQHEGKCCRCGRTLTHPDSIASGIGPECATKF